MRSERSPHRTDLKRGSKKRVAPGVYLRAGKYLVSYIDVDGKERLKTTEARNLTDAKAIREELRVKVRSGEAVAPTRATVDDVAQEFLALFESLVATGEKSERTLRLYSDRYRLHVKPKLGRVQIQAVRTEHISRLLADLRKKGMASWTLRGMVVVLSSVFNHAMTRGLLVESPLRRLSKTEMPKGKSQREHRRLTDEDCARLISKTLPTYRPIITAAAYTGMRASELLGLRWMDVDFSEGVLSVRNQLSLATKEKPARLVPLKTAKAKRDIIMLAALSDVLKGHKAEALGLGRHRPEDYVFTTERGTPMHQRNVATRGLTKAADRAGLNPQGVERLEMHDLRRTAISRWIAAGLDVMTVSRMAGHSRASVTLDLYAEEFEKAQRGAETRAKLEQGTRILLAE